jgi:hypothetical protein
MQKYTILIIIYDKYYKLVLLIAIELIDTYKCCKYLIFSIMSYFGYQSFAQLRVAQTSHKGVTAAHSAKDR